MLSDDYSHDMLVRGVAAAKADCKDEARFFLQRALAAGGPVQDRIQAWRYLADISNDSAEKRGYIENILAVDPSDGLARRTLAILDGRLDPQEIVDPNHLPHRSAEPHAVDAHTFTCPRCGSRMFYSADGRSLTCDRCHTPQPVSPRTPDDPATAGGNDFAIAMWTARGHGVPVATQSFTCRSCGASFLLRPQVLSLTCPYCGSAHVIDRFDTRELIPPDALVPFAIGQADAAAAVRDYLSRAHIDGSIIARGVYQPVWVFSYCGDVEWNGVRERSSNYDRVVPVDGSYPALNCTMRVAAARHDPSTQDVIDDFDLTKLEPFDARQLADWPAQTYDVSLEDASLTARAMMRRLLQREVEEAVGSDVQQLRTRFHKVDVDWFKLVLVPLWRTTVDCRDARFNAVVSGQTAHVWTDIPRTGVLGWLERLLGS